MRVRTQFAASVGGLAAVALAGALVPFRAWIPAANVALGLAVVVTVAAAVGGRWAGVVPGVVAALAFDLLHTRPYGSLVLRGPADLLTTGLLVVVGLVAGEVAERLHDARWRRSEVDELTRLRRLCAQAARGASDDDLTLQVAAELTDALDLRTCWYEPFPFLAELPVLADDGELSGERQRSRGLPRTGASILVRQSGRPVGRFVLAPVVAIDLPIERRILAVALVEQLAVVRALRGA